MKTIIFTIIRTLYVLIIVFLLFVIVMALCFAPSGGVKLPVSESMGGIIIGIIIGGSITHFLHKLVQRRKK